jgi:hypothetical protein
MDGTIIATFWEVWEDFRSIAVAMAPIPDHKPSGILPAFLGREPGESSDLMSPYSSTLAEFVAKFGTSAQRCRILRGYINHREALRRIGLTSGFQWLDGSFVEVMSREPNDIDFVTFYVEPASDWNEDEVAEANKAIFRPRLAKREYHCDPYFVCISSSVDSARAETMIKLTSFWHGLFSHQRETYAWRGIVSVPIATADEDADARAMLDIMERFGHGGDEA